MYNNTQQIVIETLRIFGVFLVLSLLDGCSSINTQHQWIGKVQLAESLQEKGQLNAASDEYERLAKNAPDPKLQRWVDFNRANLKYLQQGFDAAYDDFQRIHNAKIRDEYGAKSLYQIAVHTKNEQKYWDLLRLYPESYAAEKSLKYLTKKTESTNAWEPYLKKVGKLLDGEFDDFSDNLLLAQGRAFIKTNQPNRALDSFKTLVQHNNTSSLADNALWEIASLYQVNQQWEDAIQSYDLFEARIEDSYFMGTYTPHLVDDAIFEAGKISLLLLNDFEKSIHYFSKYLYYFPETILADDAMWYLSESYRLKGDFKNQKSTYKRLHKNHPESRFNRPPYNRLIP